MRITIELDPSVLKRIQKVTGQKKKSPAVGAALREFLEQQERRRLVERVLSGRTDYRATNEELEARGRYDAH